MTRILSLSCLFFLSIAFHGCRSAIKNTVENSNIPVNSVEPSNTPNILLKSARALPIDVAKLAGKSIDELDKTFGAPKESNALENGGEYRLYRVAEQPKGLAVRFYDGRAKSFNL